MTIPAPWSLPPPMRHRLRTQLRLEAAYQAFLLDTALLTSVVASARHNRIRTIRIEMKHG